MFSFTYFGYAAILVNFEKHILFDPGIIDGVPLVDIETVHPSYILVTQTPIEHFGNAVNLANDKGSILIGNSAVYHQAQQEGIYSYDLLEINTSKPLDIGADIQIIGYPLRRGGFLAPKNTAFFVKSSQGSVLHLGHANELGPLSNAKPDLLCVSVAGKKQGTFSPDAAVETTLAIHPRYVLPTSGSSIQTKQFLDQLGENKTAIQSISLKPGETFALL